MAITTNAVTRTSAQWSRPVTRWAVNGSSADASACEELVATPGSGYELVVLRIICCIGGAITATIGAGESTDNVETPVWGPFGGAAGTYELDVRDKPIQLTANKSLTVDASGAGTVCVFVEGYTRAS